ncbi:MAG: hypothetical protein ACOY90_16815 [Candidatus Zhuqueibacterota bacterium]
MTWIRAVMILSGTLALVGLNCVVFSEMQLCTSGMVGYVGVFLVVVGLLAVLLHRKALREA